MYELWKLLRVSLVSSLMLSWDVVLLVCRLMWNWFILWVIVMRVFFCSVVFYVV